MDEEDSQDELINRSTSHNKGKRAALWAISDDSDDIEEESEEGESDSGEDEEEEDHIDGEEEGGNEDEDDEEEEEETKPEDGASGGTSADFAGMSSDEDSDKCPICLNSFSSQPVATPETCEHYFCLDCILEWAKNANSCPVDRIAFNSIYLRKCYGGKVKKMITVQNPVKKGQEETVDVDLEQTNCEVCGGSDREDRLLLCDGCDAGYHMECLTPPLDSVPVEEWFCPQCESNSRHSRGSVEELSDAESLPSTARSAASRSQPRTAGPTRAIARTQQSERVRANVNRLRITQARTSELAPTYLIQSTWLDETINAVVAGLNTAVYIRDFTSHVPSRRRTKKRRRVKSRKATNIGKTGKTSSKGVRRKKRKVRKTKSRKNQMVKKTPTPRSRIANNLGIVKDKKSSSLPTVYRPSEHTLSSMRADIGAASLSIYGDPFDLDPFVDREEEGEQVQVTSLLEAKRRGISHSALRSHQPVARPITASLSRRGMNVPRSGGVVEAAPVPDLLGSILSGQSMLLMDSSDVVINRDGSLKASKQMMPSTLNPGSSITSSSGDANAHINPGMSPNRGGSSLSLHYNEDPLGFTHSSTNRLFIQSSSCLPSFTPSSASQTPPHSDMPPRGHPSLQLPRQNRPTSFLSHRATTAIVASRDCGSPSNHPATDFISKSNGMGSSPSQLKKGPTKPMWVDVSVLPRIPKIKRESVSYDASQGNSNGSSSNSSSDHYGIPETGINSLAGDKNRQQSVDQQKGTAGGQTQRHRPDGASSSSAFSNSFSSSSSTSYPASQPRYSASSSAVSFRINTSGNSWHSRRLSVPSSSAGRGSMQEHWREKQDEAKKRQLHKDKQKLLASRTVVNKEKDINSIYDPFNPTLSDSSSSDGEDESPSLDISKHEGRAASLGNKDGLVQNKLELVQVKTETQEKEVSQEEPKRANAQEDLTPEEYATVNRVLRLVDTKVDKQTLLETKVKKEPGLADAGEGEKSCHSRKTHSNSETADTTLPAHHMDRLKMEKDAFDEESGQNKNSAPTQKKQKSETKSESALRSKSPLRDLGLNKKTPKSSKERCSSSSETDRGTRGDHHSSAKRDKQKEKEKGRERSSWSSRSREKRRARSTSRSSSQSSSPETSRSKRQRSRSQSKDRRRSRSGSSSSSGEHSRRKKHKQRGNVRDRERERGRVSKDNRRGRSHSKSLSRSRSRSKDRKPALSSSRSRSRERREDHTRPALSSKDKVESQLKDKRKRRSRSNSRERRKEERSSRSSQKTTRPCAPSSKDTKQLQDKKKEKDSVQTFTEVQKQLSSTSKIKKEGKNHRAGSHATTPEITQREVGKEIKKEKHPSLDMFEDSPIIKPLKEEIDASSLTVTKGIDEKQIKEETIEMVIGEIKSETFEIAQIKLEPSSPKLSHLAPVASLSTVSTAVMDSHQDEICPCQPEQPNTPELTVSVKQEAQQSSDSDDDISVDVILDNLDCVKSERTDGSAAAIKQEKQLEEGRTEGGQILAVAGAKSKTQVKRVTWNIQEPEGPQPEKSASKLALYKLKLKQEGARRPSLTVQTSNQDNTGAVSDLSRKSFVSSSSRDDRLHPEGLPVADRGEEEDLSRKDQYLKKLHMQERAIEEVKLAIKPFYQRRDINKDEYKEILRKAVQKVCHSKSGEINPVKVGNLVKAYVDKYKHARKHKKGEDSGQAPEVQNEAMKTSDSP